MNSRVASAIATVLAASSSQSGWAQETETVGLEEIVVTAQRRTESLQDVPIAIQALTADTLSELSVTTFDDFVRYLPSVTAPSNGPGQGNIFMRGLSVGQAGSQSSGTIGVFPNVAIYLDEQSGQLPARNLDVYAADLERIEVLVGPQGVTFGAGAQAGVVRYITNKPKLDRTEGSVEGGFSTTAHGDDNSNLSAMINVPLIADKFAVRAVVYNDTRGGYIDNVPGTFTRKATDLGIYNAGYATACTIGNPDPVSGQCAAGTPIAFGPPPNSAVVNNNNVVKDDINSATYQGLRVQALYQVNDDWDVLVAQTWQDLDTNGVFYQMPNASDGEALRPLQVTLFNDAHTDDEFSLTSLTINGKFGDLQAIYSGGYLERNVEQVGDYTNYARGVYADYYQCYGANADLTRLPTCFSPAVTWGDIVRNEHMSHEFRLSTPDDWRLRGIFGAYWEENDLYNQTDWLYKTIPNCTDTLTIGCMSNVGNAPGTTVENPEVRNDNTAFYEDTLRTVDQTAFFVSVDFDLIPEVLTLTAGTRYFEFKNSFVGNVTSSFGCFEAGVPEGGCIAGATNLDGENFSSTEDGFKSRANLTWHINPDVLLYATWSEGFRPGGFNRTGGPPSKIYGPDGLPQFGIPVGYDSDDLTNKELGWKTQFLDGRLQFNGALYEETWENVQIDFFNPGETGNLTFTTNGQNFEIQGIEASIIAQVAQGLILEGAASWSESEQTNSPSLINTNPDSDGFGEPITQSCDKDTGANCRPINNLFGAPGSPSANAPELQYNLRARYEWSLGDYDAFVQVGTTYTDLSFTQASANPSISAGGVNTTRLRFENPSYSTYDASIGIAKDAWAVHLFGQNLGDENVSLFTNTGQFVVAETVLRPRVIGMKLSYKF
jgi:outer membrane receptor protein involved in Fe transport